jgi:hypothetical protein
MVGALKYVNIGGVIGLALIVYRTHKAIWALDMEQKEGQVVRRM